MFSHIFLGVHDFERAFDFYSAVMNTLGHSQRFVDRQRPWAGWESSPGSRPLFLRELVDRAYAVALANGGASEGAPGPRPQYHAGYYGAYFRDTEGNKVCVVCHDPGTSC